MTAPGKPDRHPTRPLWKEATLSLASLGGPLDTVDTVAGLVEHPTMDTRGTRFRVLFVGAVCH